MKNRQSFSCTQKKWESLEIIAKKLGITRNQLISKLVDNVLETGYIDPKIQSLDSIEKELKEQQLQKLKNKNEIHKFDKIKAEAEAKIKKYHSEHLGVVGSTPSPQAKKAMYYHVTTKPGQTIQRNYIYEYQSGDKKPHKALCKRCESLFESDEKHEAVDDVCWHLEEFHHVRPEILLEEKN